MGDFTGSSLVGNLEFDISVKPDNILNGTSNIEKSMQVVKDAFEEYELQSKKYVEEYQGESVSEYNNAFVVLKYNQEKLQGVYAGIVSLLNNNALKNRGINSNAYYKAGGR